MVLFALAASVRAQETPAIERWDRAVCLLTEAKKSDGQPACASAFLVRDTDRTYLVTAGHAAQETHARTRILYRAPDGSSQWIHLGALTTKDSDPWLGYENSDLSVMCIAGREAHARQIEQLASLSIACEALMQDAPVRTTEIEIVGFPMALGTQPTVSPLAMKGHLASREILAEAKWGKEPLLYAVPVVGAGCSGGPVFQSVAAEQETRLVGMYVGLQFDASGVKLAKIVPSRVIRAAVCRAAAAKPDSPESTK
jgi:hypothetical protein